MLDYFNWQHCRMWDACTDLNASLITTRGRLALNESWTSNTKQQIQTYQDKYISPQLPKHLDINYQHAVWTQHTIPHIYTPAQMVYIYSSHIQHTIPHISGQIHQSTTTKTLRYQLSTCSVNTAHNPTHIHTSSWPLFNWPSFPHTGCSEGRVTEMVCIHTWCTSTHTVHTWLHILTTVLWRNHDI